MVTLRNLEEGTLIRRIALLLLAVATVAGVVTSTAPSSGHVDEEAASIFGVEIPPATSLPKLTTLFLPVSHHERFLGRYVRLHPEGDQP